MIGVRDMQDAAILMDKMYRHQRHIYDLTRKPYLLGRDRLIESLAPPSGGSVLEVGCGTARNLICAARAYRNAHFYGVDVSSVMLAQAQRSVDRAGLGQRITLAQGDASSFDPHVLFGRRDFDRIFISYALSMIPPWQETLVHAFDLLSAGGSLHVVDFGDQAGMPIWFRRALKNWLDLFDVVPRVEITRELKAETRARGLMLSHQALYRGYAFHAIAQA
ncbi:class I SAM-dependent methyltransferase [Methyloferula stellata]|uniref:class I SAM-dependent methyltransferase n=1 Tax=Methyloferula stellata TaxID=876270 RepID=UPI0003753272